MNSGRNGIRTDRHHEGAGWRQRVRRRCASAPAAAQRGVALIVVLLLSMAALALGLLAATSARTEIRIAHNDVLDLRALNVAEAGLNAAFKRIAIRKKFNDELANNGTGTCTANGVGNATSGLAGIGSAKVLTSDGRCYRFVSFGGSATDGYYVRVEDNYDETFGGDAPLADADGRIRVIVHGVVGTAERIVVGMLKRVNDYAITGHDLIEVTGGSQIQGGSGVRGTMDIKVEGGAKVWGDSLAGGTNYISGGGSVTGAATNGNPPPAPPFPVPAACGGPFSSAAGITLGASATYDLAAGKLTQGGPGPGNITTLAPGTYCFHTVILNNAGQLRITGPTIINLTGEWDASFGSVSNTTSNPDNLQINVNGPGPVKLSGGAGAYLRVNGPDANIDFTGASSFWGSLVAKKVIVNGGATINYVGPVGATLSDWHEVQN